MRKARKKVLNLHKMGGGNSLTQTITYTKIPSQKDKFKDFLTDDGVMNFFGKKSKAILEQGGTPDSVGDYVSMLDKLSEIISSKSNANFDIFCFKGDSADIDRLFNFAKKFSPHYFTKNVNSPVEKYKIFNDKHLKNISGTESTITISE